MSAFSITRRKSFHFTCGIVLRTIAGLIFVVIVVVVVIIIIIIIIIIINIIIIVVIVVVVVFSTSVIINIIMYLGNHILVSIMDCRSENCSYLASSRTYS